MKVTKQNRIKQLDKKKKKAVRVTSSPTRAPVAESKVIRHLGRPNIKPLGNAGDVIVIHREYISDLLASATAGAFAVLGVPINPGNSAMFPWLSQLAENFESYTFKTLKFLFETSAATSTPGTVLMAVDYDVSDSVPASKLEMMSYRDATRSPAWECNVLDCTKEDLHKRKTYYVNDVSSSGGSFAPSVLNDLRLDDVGELLIASSNSSANAQLGEMYVEYEVELKTPEGVAGDLGGYYSAFIDPTYRTTTNAQPFGQANNFNNSSQGVFLYEGLPIRYSTPGGAASAFEISRTGTYQFTFAVKPGGTNATAMTGGADTSNGNQLYFTNTSANTAISTCQYTGIYVVRNTVPLSTSGALGFIQVNTTGGVYNSFGACTFRCARIPDYDSNQSAQSGWITFTRPERPIYSFRRKQRRAFALKDFMPSGFVLASTSSDDKEKESPVEGCSLSSPSEICVPLLLQHRTPLERAAMRAGRYVSGGG